MRMLAMMTALLLTLPGIAIAEVKLDERPAGDGDWGYRPDEGDVLRTSPPGFCWRPQSGIVAWEIQCRADGDKSSFEYSADRITMNVHRPSQVFEPGVYVWRYRGTASNGEKTNWSRQRRFSIPTGAAPLPMPPRGELLAQIPAGHPRLFLRPEDLPRLRSLARGPMKDQYRQLEEQCDRYLKSPPPTAEPPKYPPGTIRNSEEWRKMWWGNREYTIGTLNAAATLAFTRLLGGNERYGQLAKRILLDCARWDPKGSTGYRYNDEAGMPYAYYFVRTYTFVYDLLSEAERDTCRRVMKIRGDEMYRHLYPRHLWRPYSSHSNRAWHFLGEVGIALHGEVEGADEWVWFAMNVFYNVYPVWSDADGGWHEGFSYWNSYVGRFTWWADVMSAAVGINAYEKPFFSAVGFYPMYLLPPGKLGGGFGDLNARATSSRARPLVSQLAIQSGNGYWQWYVERLGGSQPAPGYIGFVRGAMPKFPGIEPDDLPSSRAFHGVGQAVLNTTIKDARQDVQVVFKSSPFGTQSHGYEANNSFLLWAYGQRLLIRSGYRDSYGTEHHRRWMWSTRSVNNITVDGHGQLAHSGSSVGRISAFHTSPSLDVVVGEAGGAYRDSVAAESRLRRFTRAILFAKPDLVIVYDRLVARQPATFAYWLHATKQFTVGNQRQIALRVGDVACEISMLAPDSLQFRQTNQYDPNPRPRITLREWHLTATTAGKRRQVEFVTLLRPHRSSQAVPAEAELKQLDGGYLLVAEISDGRVTALLPSDPAAQLSAAGLSTRGKIVIRRDGADGSPVAQLTVNTQGGSGRER